MVLSGTHRAPVRLRSAPDSVSRARAAVREALSEWGLHDLVDTAALLASEVTTNVLLHARTEFELRVDRQDGRVRVSVSDGSPRPATRRRYGLDAGTGRGLGLVETLSLDWGTEAAAPPWAKTVWFELDEAGAGDEHAEGALYGEDWLALVDDL